MKITVPATGYGNTIEEVVADAMGKATGAFLPGVEIEPDGDIELHRVGQLTSRSTTEAAAGREFYATIRFARRPPAIHVHTLALAGDSPLIDTLTMVREFLQMASGQTPEVDGPHEGENSLGATVSVTGAEGGKIIVTVTHEYPAGEAMADEAATMEAAQ